MMTEVPFIVVKNWMASHDAMSVKERQEWIMKVLK